MQQPNSGSNRTVSVSQAIARIGAKMPTFYATEDFEGTEALLRAEVFEGRQEAKEGAE